MKRFKILVALIGLLIIAASNAQAQKKEKQDNPFEHPFANPVDDPSLERVLIIGDSISVAYTPKVRRILEGQANVHRPKTNCRWSAYGDEKIEEWIGDSKWDVIHFNFGLWDWYGWRQEEKATPESYAQNLESIVRKLKKTNAKLIFALTTPPCIGPEGKAKIVVTQQRAREFNEAASAVMKKHGVEVNDLFALIGEKRTELQRGANDVHYTEKARELLAAKVANTIAASLAKSNPENSAKAGVEKAARLPNALILGDSISLGYTPMVVRQLKGKVNVQRPKANCGDTNRYLKSLPNWLGKTKWDVIHFNVGLHDLCYRHPDSKVQGNRDKVNGTIAVPIKEYEKNLTKILKQLKATNAKLIWASTTVVPEDEAGRIVGDDLKYNAIAAKIMNEHGVTINDLHKLSTQFPAGLFKKPGDVHFQIKGSQLLARQVTNAIEDALKTSEPKDLSKTRRAKKKEEYAKSVPKPSVAEIRYGKHSRQVIDFWQAKSDSPTPLVFVIHGGGWKGGSKERIDRFVDVADLLENGISVAAINYRYTKYAQANDIQPAVKVPLNDAARALQFVRSKAKDWNIDKERIAATGSSAGACSSLWLAFHDDLAEAKSDDLISRESTRLWCVAVRNAQTTLDPNQMRAWTPNSRYGGHAFGLPNFKEFLAERESIMPWIKEYSPYANLTSDDPPVYMTYKTPPAIGKIQKDPTHTSNFGVKLSEHCRETGVECELVYPGAPNVKHETVNSFLIGSLKK